MQALRPAQPVPLGLNRALLLPETEPQIDMVPTDCRVKAAVRPQAEVHRVAGAAQNLVNGAALSRVARTMLSIVALAPLL